MRVTSRCNLLNICSCLFSPPQINRHRFERLRPAVPRNAILYIHVHRVSAGTAFWSTTNLTNHLPGLPHHITHRQIALRTPRARYLGRECSRWTFRVNPHPMTFQRNGLYPARASGQAGSFTYVASPLQQPHVQIRWESHFPTHDGAPYDSHDILAHSYPSPSVTSHRPRSSADNKTLRDPCQPNNLYPTLPPLPGPPPAAPQHNEYPPGTVRCQWDRGCEDPVEGASPSGIGRHLRRFHDISMTDNRLRQRCRWGVDCGKTLFASNLGKHIAECHLRSLTKQCPHCGADFARADTLTRHIKGFCASRAEHTETTRT